MRQDVAIKMLDVSQAVLKREKYSCLLEEYRRLDKQVLSIFREIKPSQRDALMEYMAVLGDMNLCLLEEACMEALTAGASPRPTEKPKGCHCEEQSDVAISSEIDRPQLKNGQ